MTDSIEILVKLFDTLKEASDENKRTTQVLVSQQQELVNYMKTLPIVDFKELLKEHATKSGTDIDACTLKVETKTESILQKMRSIDGKITKMLIVITVFVGLLAVAYFIARSTTDVEQIKNDITKEIDSEQKKEHQAIIDTIEKAIKKYHENRNDNSSE